MKLPEVRRGDWVIVETEKGSKIVPLSCTRMSRHQAKAIEIWAKEYKKELQPGESTQLTLTLETGSLKGDAEKKNSPILLAHRPAD